MITPVFNGERFLAACIESVLAQSYDHWEYVIVDNASTDGTPDIIQQYADLDERIRPHGNAQTLPYIDNWNHAVSLMAPGSHYCKIVHADDGLLDRCLERMVTLAEEHPSVGIVGSWLQRGDRVMAKWDGAPGAAIPGRLVGRLSLLSEIPYLFGSPSALLLRADIIRSRERLYPEVDHPLVDQALCYELLVEWDFGYVPEVLTFNRLHDESITAAQADRNEWFFGKLRLLERFGTAYLSAEEKTARIDDYIDRYYGFLARQVGRGRGRGFWRYHTKAMRKVGHPLDRRRLARHVLGGMWPAIRRRTGKHAGSHTDGPARNNSNHMEHAQ